MPVSSAHDVTQLLRAWSQGEPGALEKLTPVVYDELYPAGAELHGSRTARSDATNDRSGE
jgi:hypothetical protein